MPVHGKHPTEVSSKSFSPRTFWAYFLSTSFRCRHIAPYAIDPI